MQVLITHDNATRTRVLQLGRWQLAGAVLALGTVLLLLSGTVYHFVFLKAAREGWPVVSTLVRWAVRDEIAERERFMRDNLAAMAQRVGEFEARLVHLQAMGERVYGLAGIQPEDLQPETLVAPAGSPLRPGLAPAAGRASGPATGAGTSTAPGPAMGAAPAPARPEVPTGPARGGPFVAAAGSPSLQHLQGWLDGLDLQSSVQADLFTLVESRLMESRLLALMVPTVAPVDGPVGSGFGFRDDPFSGRAALHTGLDFPADNGTPIHAAAGGIVVVREYHPAYGHMMEIDHGNGLSTRYAHCSAFEVPLGAVVRPGELIARVGSSGRSTGPHLHFEVLLGGLPQNPARFLGRAAAAPTAFATPPRLAPR